MKQYKQYGKKGNKRRDQQSMSKKKEMALQRQDSHALPEQPDVDDILAADSGALIRPREGIIVDWAEDPYAELFYDGKATWDNDNVLPDAELDKAQQARKLRRKNGITLDDCLDEFEREEVLSEQDTWYCPRCKRHQRATKKFDLWKTPDILVVHLKRFSSSGYRRDKLEVLVDFPLEGLDLTKRVQNKEDGKEEVYDLIGIDCHWGGLGGGHYTAHAKNFVDNQWYSYNGMSPSSLGNGIALY
jgi:ubiquitin carboxyl-terminal hydrolase 4/11